MPACRTAAVLMLSVLAAAPGARAQTLAQKQMMAKQDAALAEAVPPLTEACGITPKVAIDWKSFLASPAGDHSVSGFCAEPLSTIRSMCEDPLAKQAVAEKIKSYTCGFGGPGKRALALDQGALRMDVDWDAANTDDFVRGWLGDHL